MGKIETSNTHASHQQLFNHLHAAGLGAQRADHLYITCKKTQTSSPVDCVHGSSPNSLYLCLAYRCGVAGQDSIKPKLHAHSCCGAGQSELKAQPTVRACYTRIRYSTDGNDTDYVHTANKKQYTEWDALLMQHSLLALCVPLVFCGLVLTMAAG